MKNLVEFFLDFLKGTNGGNSYKRLLGIGCFIAAVTLVACEKGSDFMIASFLGVSTAAAGLTVLEKRHKE
jgi:hypothetical protein